MFITIGRHYSQNGTLNLHESSTHYKCCDHPPLTHEKPQPNPFTSFCNCVTRFYLRVLRRTRWQIQTQTWAIASFRLVPVRQSGKPLRLRGDRPRLLGEAANTGSSETLRTSGYLDRIERNRKENVWNIWTTNNRLANKKLTQSNKRLTETNKMLTETNKRLAEKYV